MRRFCYTHMSMGNDSNTCIPPTPTTGWDDGLKVGVGAGLAGEYEDEDEDDEETGAPCLNKMVALHAKDGQVLEFEVTQRAAELLLDKFTIVIQALDMFEKVETQLQYQDELA